MRTRSTSQLTSTRLQRARHSLLVLFLSFLQASVVRCSALPDANSNIPRNNLEQSGNRNNGDTKRCPLDSPLPPPPPPPLPPLQQQQPSPNRAGEMEAADADPKKAVGDAGAEADVQAEETIPERFVIGCNGDRVEAARRCRAGRARYAVQTITADVLLVYTVMSAWLGVVCCLTALRHHAPPRVFLYLRPGVGSACWSKCS